MRTATSLSIEFARELERAAKIELHGLSGRDHFLKQTEFGFVFDVADGQRTQAERAAEA